MGTQLDRAVCACQGPWVQSLCERVSTGLSRRSFLSGIATSSAALAVPALVMAQQGEKPLLLRGAKVFDGVAARAIEGRELLMIGGAIADLVPAGQAITDATIVDCKGTALIPGLIDAHWHAMMVAIFETPQ